MSPFESGMEGLLLLFGLFMLLVAYRYMLAPAVLANWRQDLFKLRNDMFDDMFSCDLVAHPAHLELRERVNAVIRTGRSLNLISSILLVRFGSQCAGTGPGLVDLIESVENADARARLKLYHRDCLRLIVHRIFFDTMPGMLFSWPTVMLFFCYSRAKFFLATLTNKAMNLGTGMANQVKRNSWRFAEKIEWDCRNDRSFQLKMRPLLATSSGKLSHANL